MTTPDLRPHVHNCLLLEDRDDESVVDSPSCDGCECMDAASCVVTHGKGSQQPLQTAATSTAAAAAAATTTTAASVKNDGQQPPSNLVPTADLGSPSTSAFSMGELGEPNPTSREHSYDLRSRIPRPPNAFMLFAQEKRRLVAAQNPNENNQIVSTRLGKMWLALSVADKDLYRRKAALEATKHRKKYPDYVYNPLDARHRKEQERRAKQIAAKLMKGIEEPPAVTAKESGGASSHEQDKDSKEAGSATRRLTMQRRRRRAAAGGITRTRCATHTAPQQTRKTPKQTTTAARRRTAFVQAMATTSRPSAAFDEQRRLAAQSAQRRDATNGSAAPHASQFPAPATHQFDARMSLVSCGRDCAAVPCAQTHCPSTSCVAGDGTQPQGWLDFSTQASAASQMASGLATSRSPGPNRSVPPDTARSAQHRRSHKPSERRCIRPNARHGRSSALGSDGTDSGNSRWDVQRDDVVHFGRPAGPETGRSTPAGGVPEAQRSRPDVPSRCCQHRRRRCFYTRLLWSQCDTADSLPAPPHGFDRLRRSPVRPAAQCCYRWPRWWRRLPEPNCALLTCPGCEPTTFYDRC
ncbi:uncharacterized protein LOC144097122 isoform X3 [Amblyomma americanum]